MVFEQTYPGFILIASIHVYPWVYQALVEVLILNAACCICILGDNFKDSRLFLQDLHPLIRFVRGGHLAIKDSCFTVLGVAAVHAEELVPVCRFDMYISPDSAIL